MCELFAMSARHATTVSLSLEEFSRHGGLSGPHKDASVPLTDEGWVALGEGEIVVARRGRIVGERG